MCDDGLQQRALARTVEVVVVDGARGFGNGYLLPAGPLREPLAQLSGDALVVVNGTLNARCHSETLAAHPQRYQMELKAKSLYTPVYGKHYAVDHFKGRRVHACAALGNPERFFASLKSLGMSVLKHAFRDHHAYRVVDFKFGERLPVIMTAKDGVKWADLAEQGNKIEADVWILETQLQIDKHFEKALYAKLGYPSTMDESDG